MNNQGIIIKSDKVFLEANSYGLMQGNCYKFIYKNEIKEGKLVSLGSKKDCQETIDILNRELRAHKQLKSNCILMWFSYNF